MSQYFIQRLLLVIPTLIGVLVILFALVRVLPGDVVDQVGGTFGTGPSEEARREQVRHQLGLDKPAHRQFFTWVGDLLRGDLGRSLISRFSVAQELKARIPVTLEMAALAMAISLLIALPIGVLSAIRQDSIVDYLTRGSAILLLAIPGFWIGTMIIALPNRYWGWSPPLRYVDLWDDPFRNLYTMVFPAAILGVGLAGSVLRLVRAQMLEVLRQDYIRTAWAKGLQERTIVARHAMKNAFIPVVTLIGTQVPVLIGGTVILESLFNVPGIGRYLISSLGSRDYPVVQGINLVFAAAVILTNLVVDMTYAYLDPRVRYR